MAAILRDSVVMVVVVRTRPRAIPLAMIARYLRAISIGVTEVFEGTLCFLGFKWRSVNLVQLNRGAILKALRSLSHWVLFCCFAISFSLSQALFV